MEKSGIIVCFSHESLLKNIVPAMSERCADIARVTTGHQIMCSAVVLLCIVDRVQSGQMKSRILTVLVESDIACVT